MPFLRFMTFLVVATCLFPVQQSLAGPNLIDLVQERLRNRIETAGRPTRLAVGSEAIYASASLPRFYERRGYVPAWINELGPLNLIESLMHSLSTAYREGLVPQDYHLQRIQSTLKKIGENPGEGLSFNPGRLVDLDLLLSDAFLIYASHCLSGQVNPDTFDPEWYANRRGADVGQALEAALSSSRIAETLRQFLPSQTGYWKLRKALADYRKIAQNGGWKKTAQGPALKSGSSGDRVADLYARLANEPEFIPANASEAVFDASLEEKVRIFQHRHGLDEDGVAGQATLSALNVSASERVQQISINMERWRWLPRDLGANHILVNLPSFNLVLFEEDEIVMHMRVIVGKSYRRTPVFSDTMRYLVLCPYWHVPPGIAVKDKLPLIKKNPEYLRNQNMRVFQGWGAQAKELDPTSITWDSLSAENFPYRLRQDSGPENALGRIKFMFPNRFHVYMHDTPSRELFAKSTRTFSSGCIRIEKPLELAEYLLQDDPHWNKPAIQAQIARNIEKTVTLLKPVNVHMQYWTAFVDQDGLVHFRNDIYGRDKRLHQALLLPPPTSTTLPIISD